MNKGPWGGRGAEFLKSGGVVGWNVSYLLLATFHHIATYNNIVVFDYFIHSLYTVINTQRGCHTLKKLEQS